MQYAAVGLLKDHASLLTAAVTTLAVNARHVFYGISMMEQYRDAGRGKGYLIFSLTDETYSLLCDRELTEKAHDRKRFFMTVSVIDHIYWITGCTLGGLFSSVIPDVASGAEFALTALFVSVFTGQWTGTEDHVPAVTGVSCSLLCLVLFGKDRFLIPSMLMIVTVLLAHRRKEHDA
jgi:4-azaleucine resistance transporter AzlC